MAKKRKNKKPFTVTVRRVGETGAPPAPASSGSHRGHGRIGTSPAVKHLTGAVSSARKAAARAGQVMRSEPTRVAAGTIIGSGIGKIGADMIHDSAVKNPTGYAAKNEAVVNGLMGGIAAIAGIGVALMGSQSTPKRYAVSTLSHVASFGAGGANAINNAKKRPVPTTAGPDDTDPFGADGGDVGAPRRQRVQARRKAMASRMASAMRAEDPQGAGTEGPELEEYCGGVIDDALGEITELEGALASEDVGSLPVAALAALANPQTAQAVNTLLSLVNAKGKAELERMRSDLPVTAAVLELEGAAPEELGATAKTATAKDLRRERRELRADIRRQKRTERKTKRAERRKDRKDRKVDKLEADVDQLREQARPASPPRRRQPILIRTVAQQQPEQSADEYEDDEPLVIIMPTDEEIQAVSGGRY